MHKFEFGEDMEVVGEKASTVGRVDSDCSKAMISSGVDETIVRAGQGQGRLRPALGRRRTGVL